MLTKFIPTLAGIAIGAVTVSVAIGQSAQTSSGQGSSSGSGQATASASSSAQSSGRAVSSGTGSGQTFGTTTGSGRTLNKPNYAVFWSDGENYTNLQDPNVGKAITGHMNYMNSLAKQGNVVWGGPWRDEFGGMTLMKFPTDEEIKRIVERDPAVQAGIFKYEIKAWNITVDGSLHNAAIAAPRPPR